MLFVYDRGTKSFSPCQETSFGEIGIKEAIELESFIVDECSSILGEEVLVISRQYNKFETKERPDIIALDMDGDLVIMELKRDDSGKTEEMQALKYAAYCSNMTFDDVVEARREYLKRYLVQDEPAESIRAEITNFVSVGEQYEGPGEQPKIVLVSTTFRKEVTATVLWLQDRGLDISCIQVRPYMLDDQRVGITVSRILPLPEAKDFLVGMREKREHVVEAKRQESKYMPYYERLGGSVIHALEGVPGMEDDWAYHHAGSYCAIFRRAWKEKHPQSRFIPFYHYEFNYLRSSRINISFHIEQVKSHHGIPEQFRNLLRATEFFARAGESGKHAEMNVFFYSESVTALDSPDDDEQGYRKGIDAMVGLIQRTKDIINDVFEQVHPVPSHD